MTSRSNCRQKHPVLRAPIDLSLYDRRLALSAEECIQLDAWVRDDTPRTREQYLAYPALQRFIPPVRDVLRPIPGKAVLWNGALKVLFFEMHQRQTSLWDWTNEAWLETFCSDRHAFEARYQASRDSRRQIIAVAYLLCGFSSLERALYGEYEAFAYVVFGSEAVDKAVQQIVSELHRYGYREGTPDSTCAQAISAILLLNRSPRLEDITDDLMERVKQECRISAVRESLFKIARVLYGLRIITKKLSHYRCQVRQSQQMPDVGASPTTKKPDHNDHQALHQTSDALGDVADEWIAACELWYEISELAEKTRYSYRWWLLQIGHWLARTYPNVTSPAAWTPEVARDFVRAVTNMTIGAWSHSSREESGEVENQLKPGSIDAYLKMSRTFFKECKTKGLFPIQIVPDVDLQTPPYIRNQIGPRPRTIVNDVWRELLRAGMELSEADLEYEHSTNTPWYSVEMVRAIAVIWLFGGLRPDQIRWLEVDCIEWWLDGVSLKVGDETPPLDATCYIKVPPQKGAPAFWKDCSRYIGLAIQEWVRIRPDAPLIYHKASQRHLALLFMNRMHMLGKRYLNASLIPLLCKKAGVDIYDTKGKISAHRARSNALTELAYNRERPRTLEEVRVWAGHDLISTLMYYLEERSLEQQPAYEASAHVPANMANAPTSLVESPLSPAQIIALQKCVRCHFFRLRRSGLPLVAVARTRLLQIPAQVLGSEGDLVMLQRVLSALDSIRARLCDGGSEATDEHDQ